jgi:muramidase (phage lysozyme)
MKKVLLITESQYKKLVSKGNLLTERFKKIIYNDPKDEYDAHPDLLNVLNYLLYLVQLLYNKDLYIDKIENGVVYIDSTKYEPEEIDYLKQKLEEFIKDSKDPKDKISTSHFGFDSGLDDDYQWDDVAEVDDNDDTTEEIDDNDDTTEEIDDNDDVAEVEDDEVVDDYEHAPDKGDGSFHIPLDSCVKDIMYMISTAETPGGNHSYDSVNMGLSGIRSGIVSGISKMTVKEALKHVKEKSTTKNNNIAMGRYQYVPDEIDKYLNRVGLNRNSKFSPKNQDKMASAVITEAGINKGCDDLYQLIPTLWAGIPILIGPKRGQSKYKSGINSAQIKPEYYENVLKQCGCKYNTIDKKWEKFTPKIIADDSTDFDKYLTDNGIVPVEPGTGPKNGVQFDKIPGTTDYRSGQPTLGELAWMLQNYDIKRVIRLNASKETSVNGEIKVPTKEERKLVEAAGAEFYPKTGDFVSAHAGYVKNKGYQQTIKKVLPILEKGNTLIHCRNGADRTGYLVAKYIKDKQKWDNQKLWDYTTEYNSWCGQTKEKFNGSDPETSGGYSSYAQGFIEGVNSDKRDELCDKRKSFDFENEEDSESTTKDGKIKVLIIGDSHSVDNSVNYSRKLLNKKGYSGKIIAKSGKNPKWMYDELLKVKNKIKDYDWFIVFGGGNAAYRSKTDGRAITNLSKIYDLIIKEKGGKANIIAITPPTKKFAHHGKFPSNQTISDWVMSQKDKTKYQYNLSGLKKEHFRKQREKNRTTNKMVDTWYHLNGNTHNEILQYLLKDIK